MTFSNILCMYENIIMKDSVYIEYFAKLIFELIKVNQNSSKGEL